MDKKQGVIEHCASVTIFVTKFRYAKQAASPHPFSPDYNINCAPYILWSTIDNSNVSIVGSNCKGYKLVSLIFTGEIWLIGWFKH